MIQSHRILESKHNNHSVFLKVFPEDANAPKQQEIVQRDAHIPKRWVMDVCYYLRGLFTDWYWEWSGKQLEKGD